MSFQATRRCSFIGQCYCIEQTEAAKCLLNEMINLWLTIRGFSIARAWVERYKVMTSANVRNKRGLRKGLRQTENST